MKPPLRASLVVVGLALLSATPAAPGFIRHLDLGAVHLFRLLDAGIVALRDPPAASRNGGVEEAVRQAVQEGLAARDAELRSGSEMALAQREPIVARVVAVDHRRRRLLIDAGPGIEMRQGDPVMAGQIAIGRVDSSRAGVAVVVTPFSPAVRFSGACYDGESTTRFVLTGLDRDVWVAAITHPERASGLQEGLTVFTPEVQDLVPESIPTLPPRLALGDMRRDLMLARTGREAFCVTPRIDVSLLDAVTVVPAVPPSSRESLPSVERRSTKGLACGLASPWRDGGNLIASGLTEGAVVTVDDWYAGTIIASQLGVSRVRGVFDPGQVHLVLVVGAGEARPLLIESVEAWNHGGRMRLLSGEPPAIGQILITSGRGRHTQRGIPIGVVSRSDVGSFDARRPVKTPDPRLDVLRRPDFPADPWGGG